MRDASEVTRRPAHLRATGLETAPHPCYVPPAMAVAPDIVPRAQLAQIIATDTALRESLLHWAMVHTRHPQEVPAGGPRAVERSVAAPRVRQRPGAFAAL